jgi:hypothetical protein
MIHNSTLRQIPDTQEVLLYPHSNVSIIVEILQRVERSHFNEAIRCVLYHLTIIHVFINLSIQDFTLTR